MKTNIPTLSVLGLITSIATAGSTMPDIAEQAQKPTGFESARRPISNPTLFDLALPTTNVHPIFLHHRLPSSINTTSNPSLPVGGDVQLYALQFEIAMNERTSIVATKDGYVDFNPNSSLSEAEGFANLGLGLKHAFLLDPVSKTAVSGTMTFEIPTGNAEVLQGEGEGAVNLILNGLKLVDAWQFAAAAGTQIPFSNEQSLNGFVSTHVSYELCSCFIPLIELNWFHVIDSGNGNGNHPSQVGGAVPNVIKFEGGDLFNLGGANAGDNRDFVSTAIGFRSRLNDAATLGVAYEIPLTDAEDSLMKDRITVDLVWTF